MRSVNKAELETARMLACPSRRNGGCGEIDVALGFTCSLPLPMCDRCFAAGGREQGGSVRSEFIGLTVEGIASQPARAPAGPLSLVIRHHVPPDRAREVLRLCAPRLGKALAIDCAHHLGMREEIQHLFGGMSDEEQISALDPGLRASAENFGEAEEWSLAQKFASLAEALASGRGCDRATVNQRHISCHGTDLEGNQVGAPCPSRRESQSEPGAFYCADCGCGERQVARLRADAKFAFVKLRCPRRRKGFSNQIT